MQKHIIIVCVLGAALLYGCNNNQRPNVENIEIKLTTKRFEKDFFQIDTNHIEDGLKNLETKYPVFFQDFKNNILGLRDVDSTKYIMMIKKFIHDYTSVFDSTKMMDAQLDQTLNTLKKSFQYVHYYFPNYQLPTQFITFVGPIDAFAYGAIGGSGEIITHDAIGAGLQLHLGNNSEIYKSEIAQQLYPEYISRKFTTEYIPCNCMKNIIDDIYPELPSNKSMLDILIDHGKRMYLLDLFMPFEKDEIKLGYTTAQLKGTSENEGYIWNYFTENNLLYQTDILRFRSFVTDGPLTSEFGIGSPGFISLFMGRQIIRAYMEQKPETSIEQLLKLDPKTILSISKYRPK
ncbi:MAG: hypothetical protein RL634_1508 [Bacteroidota bacterium]